MFSNKKHTSVATQTFCCSFSSRTRQSPVSSSGDICGLWLPAPQVQRHTKNSNRDTRALWESPLTTAPSITNESPPPHTSQHAVAPYQLLYWAVSCPAGNSRSLPKFTPIFFQVWFSLPRRQSNPTPLRISPFLKKFLNLKSFSPLFTRLRFWWHPHLTPPGISE